MAKIINITTKEHEPPPPPEPVKRIWCRIGLHVWSRWEHQAFLEEYKGGPLSIGRYSLHAKQCCECDLVKTKRVKL
jgi:hypothetical protein